MVRKSPYRPVRNTRPDEIKNYLELLELWRVWVLSPLPRLTALAVVVYFSYDKLFQAKISRLL